MSDNEKKFLTLCLLGIMIMVVLGIFSDLFETATKYNCFEKTQNVECLRGK
jgi:hypothetical protein